jgi:hypothetical protein
MATTQPPFPFVPFNGPPSEAESVVQNTNVVYYSPDPSSVSGVEAPIHLQRSFGIWPNWGTDDQGRIFFPPVADSGNEPPGMLFRGKSFGFLAPPLPGRNTIRGTPTRPAR